MGQLSHIQLSHTQLSHTQLSRTQLSHTRQGRPGSLPGLETSVDSPPDLINLIPNRHTGKELQ